MIRKRSILVILGILLIFTPKISFSQSEETKNKEMKYFEVYRQVGKGKDLREAKEDAYQNAIIEFLKVNVSSKDIKENSQKLLKELLSSSKIKNFIESEKIISQEYIEDGQKIIIDIVLRVGKIIEVLQKLDIPLKETSKFYKEQPTSEATDN
ncbi:MAG: hypothetical protein ACP5PT_02555 [Brevinematia bacterium]|jgi:hypothetical protein